MAQVLIYPRGQLTDDDRARLSEVGIVAVEADDPQKVVTTVPGTELTCNDLLASALAGITVDQFNKDPAFAMAEEMNRRTKAKENAP